MMDSMHTFFKILLPATMIAALITGTCFSEETHDRAKRLKEAGDILPLEKIIERAREKYTGTVLETELEEKKGRLIYEIELLDKNGVVRELKFDARTGELLKMKEEK